MTPIYRTFFGFTREPFASDLKPEEILQTPEELPRVDPESLREREDRR